jgi:hypothetical protein
MNGTHPDDSGTPSSDCSLAARRVIGSSNMMPMGARVMWLPEWLYEVLTFLCAIAVLANASWDFRKE